MKERIDIQHGHVHPDIFDARTFTQTRPFDANMNQWRALHQVFGIQNVTALIRDSNNPDVREQLDDAFNHFIRDRFMDNIDPEHRERHMAELFKGANQIVSYFVNNYFPEGDTTYAQLNESMFAPHSMSEYLQDYCFDTNVVERLRFETTRSLGLAAIYGSIISRDRQNKVSEMTSKLMHDLNRGFWSEGAGSGKTIDCFSVHDNISNTALAWSVHQNDFTQSRTEHIKHHSMRMRTVNIGGKEVLVHTHPRTKDPVTASIKALRSTIEPDRRTAVTDPYRSVQDSMGMMFTIFDSDITPEKFAETYLRFLHHEQNTKIRDVREKHSVSRHPINNSATPQFLRYQIFFHETNGIPLEVMIYSPGNYFDNKYQIRSEPQPEGPLNGVAHGLYELTRDEEVAVQLFPPNIYGPHMAEEEMRRLFEIQRNKRAHTLLNQNRI